MKVKKRLWWKNGLKEGWEENYFETGLLKTKFLYKEGRVKEMQFYGRAEKLINLYKLLEEDTFLYQENFKDEKAQLQIIFQGNAYKGSYELNDDETSLKFSGFYKSHPKDGFISLKDRFDKKAPGNYAKNINWAKAVKVLQFHENQQKK